LVVPDIVIRHLSRQMAEHSPSETMRVAAKATGAVPVHEDGEGVLLVMGDARVLRFEPTTLTLWIVDDPRQQILALTLAASHFPDLAALRPA
jgi:hypothetical protein